MRKPMITRTIQTTCATVMFIDTTNPTPYTNDIVLPRTYKNDDAMLFQSTHPLRGATTKRT